jgi:hypothetical protein
VTCKGIVKFYKPKGAEQLKSVVDRWRGHVAITLAANSLWSGELSVTLTDEVDGSAKSLSFTASGYLSPSETASVLLREFNRWLYGTKVTGGSKKIFDDWLRDRRGRFPARKQRI